MRRYIDLIESGVYLNGEERVVDDSPSMYVCKTIEQAFKNHPQLLNHVDLMLEPETDDKLNIGFIESNMPRQGYAGMVFDLLTKAADHFGVTLRLHAHFSEPDYGQKINVLSQDGLEQFYGRRGFQLIDPVHRFMERQPQG